jgi:Uma2 family endonuclease
VSILEVEMSAALQHPIGPNTIEDWLALPESADGSRTELIFGHLHVSPCPSGEHQIATPMLWLMTREALRAAGRRDLHVSLGVYLKISSTLRTALIPDVVVLDRPPAGASFPPESVVIAIEVWSPGNGRTERQLKLEAYALAGVPFVWTVERWDEPELTTYRLANGRYAVENTARGGRVTITASPVPVTVDLDGLLDS